MIEVKNLNYLHILKNLNFNIKENSITGIIGKNGSGKTTLLRLLAGFIKPENGEIFLNGTNIIEFSTKHIARNLVYIPQKITINYDIKVKEFLFFSRYAWADSQKKSDNLIMEALEKVDMKNYINSNCRVLSGGEMAKIMLASAIVQQSPVWVLDEPTAFLDPKSEVDFFKMLKKSVNNKTVIIVTHNLFHIFKTATHIISLKDGEVIYDKKTELYSENDLLNVYNVKFNMKKQGDKLICYPES